MSQKFLPPLEADVSYRVADFQHFEYGHRYLRKAMTGEDTSILHLHLKNRTTLDLPVSDDALENLMNVLIEAMPQKALARVKQRWPDEFVSR